MLNRISTGRHIPPPQVDQLYIRINKKRLSQTRLAEHLGISRTTLHLMFKHELPMRRVYGLAITAILQGIKL
jgi:hypothetical protein